jgi:hypothetical protein
MALQCHPVLVISAACGVVRTTYTLQSPLLFTHASSRLLFTHMHFPILILSRDFIMYHTSFCLLASWLSLVFALSS